MIFQLLKSNQSLIAKLKKIFLRDKICLSISMTICLSPISGTWVGRYGAMVEQLLQAPNVRSLNYIYEPFHPRPLCAPRKERRIFHFQDTKM